MKNKKKVDKIWIFIITITAFLLSIIFSLLSELIIPNVYFLFSLIIILFVILFGVIFDMIGVAITVAESKVFNSMASNNIKSAKIALRLIKNSEKVSSFCNDVIGDICGIISGSCGTTISSIIILKYGIESIFPVLIITAFIASITIGLKAIGKSIAIKNSSEIINIVSKILYPILKKSNKKN